MNVFTGKMKQIMLSWMKKRSFCLCSMKSLIKHKEKKYDISIQATVTI